MRAKRDRLRELDKESLISAYLELEKQVRFLEQQLHILEQVTGDSKASKLDPDRLSRLGEHIAARHLQSLEWKILEIHWGHLQGAIDIVARDPNGVLVFIDVRTRRNYEAMLRALETVDQADKDQLNRIVGVYRREHDIPESVVCRVDIVGVTLENNGHYKLELIYNALG